MPKKTCQIWTHGQNLLVLSLYAVHDGDEQKIVAHYNDIYHDAKRSWGSIATRLNFLRRHHFPDVLSYKAAYPNVNEDAISPIKAPKREKKQILAGTITTIPEGFMPFQELPQEDGTLRGFPVELITTHIDDWRGHALTRLARFLGLRGFIHLFCGK